MSAAERLRVPLRSNFMVGLRGESFASSRSLHNTHTRTYNDLHLHAYRGRLVHVAEKHIRSKSDALLRDIFSSPYHCNLFKVICSQSTMQVLRLQ